MPKEGWKTVNVRADKYEQLADMVKRGKAKSIGKLVERAINDLIDKTSRGP